MTLESLLENVFVVHLPHREDRKAHIEKEMKKIGPFQYFDAINGHESNYTGPLLKGEWGIKQTHIELLKKANGELLNTILILEDDVVFTDQVIASLSEAIKHLPDDFDLFYLGGAHKEIPTHYAGDLFKVTNTVTLHAVFVNAKAYGKLIDNIECFRDEPVDNVYASLQPSLKAYVHFPHIAWQREDYSDIQNKFVDYPWLKTR